MDYELVEGWAENEKKKFEWSQSAITLCKKPPAWPNTHQDFFLFCKMRQIGTSLHNQQTKHHVSLENWKEFQSFHFWELKTGAFSEIKSSSAKFQWEKIQKSLDNDWFSKHFSDKNKKTAPYGVKKFAWTVEIKQRNPGELPRSNVSVPLITQLYRIRKIFYQRHSIQTRLGPSHFSVIPSVSVPFLSHAPSTVSVSAQFQKFVAYKRTTSIKI